ncbi:MAG: prepilin peptidase [Bacillus sp. (in: Bacteria)]|nr:prepilin peptidase [Bacillus sp. (in: firmicutes)]
MWSNFLLVILLIICVITDLRKRKIYNDVLLPFLLASWVLHAFTSGLPGLIEALLGTLVGLGILLIPYLLGGMGAGDVKLLAVIGGIKGIEFVLMASLYMALTGGIIAIFVILFRKGFLKKTMYLLYGLRHGMGLSLLEDKDTMKSSFPYGVAIAAGAFYQIFFPGILPL